MSDQTKIEWTDATWNPLRGCSKVDLDCRNCYAEKVAARFGGAGQPYEGTVDERGRWSGAIRLVPEHLADPLRWQRPRKVFVNSMSDLFHESVPFGFVAAVFGVMAGARRHTFQLLTKRPERAKAFFEWLRDRRDRSQVSLWLDCTTAALKAIPDLPSGVGRSSYLLDPTGPWPLPNVLIGTSVGYAKALPRIDQLREVDAAVRFLSLEPLHGPLGDIDLTGIGWVIVGGESGPDARPMYPSWATSVRDQSVAAGVPFFFKQWGEWAPDGTIAGVEHMRKIGKHAAGRILDGRTWDEYPVQP